MTLMNNHQLSPLKPNPNIPGGSKKGKPQKYWPWFYKVVVDAIALRWQGGTDAMLNFNKKIPVSELRRLVDGYFPGFWDELRSFLGYRATDVVKLARNRIYYMYYDQKRKVAVVSHEHWRNHVDSASMLVLLHHNILSGDYLPDSQWKRAWL